MATLVSTREGTKDQEIWDQMADELVECIAAYLVPGSLESPWLSRPLSDVSSYYAQASIGAAHMMQLSKALFRRGQRNKWELSLQRNRRCRIETTACCRPGQPLARSRASEPLGQSLWARAQPAARHG